MSACVFVKGKAGEREVIKPYVQANANRSVLYKPTWWIYKWANVCMHVWVCPYVCASVHLHVHKHACPSWVILNVAQTPKQVAVSTLKACGSCLMLMKSCWLPTLFIFNSKGLYYICKWTRRGCTNVMSTFCSMSAWLWSWKSILHILLYHG